VPASEAEPGTLKATLAATPGESLVSLLILIVNGATYVRS